MLTLFLVGLFGGGLFYYFQVGRYQSITRNNGEAQTFSQLETTLSDTCSMQTVDYVKSDEGKIKMLDLLNIFSIDKTKLLSNGLTFSFREVGTGPSYCWVAYVGSPEGQGEISYENKDGKLKKQKVTNFPVFATSLLDNN